MYIEKSINDVEWFPQDNAGTIYVSELLVMKSAAGWYIGRICEVMYEFEDDVTKGIEPYERCTDYMTYDQAKTVLPRFLEQDICNNM
jgi:hypothetical protein